MWHFTSDYLNCRWEIIQDKTSCFISSLQSLLLCFLRFRLFSLVWNFAIKTFSICLSHSAIIKDIFCCFPKMFCKQCTHLLPALKGSVASLFLQSHRFHCKMMSDLLSTVAIPGWSLSSLLGYFISALNSPDSSSSDRVWLVFTTSSANPDTWFHWGRWDLKGGGHGSPNPLLHVTWFTVPV